MRRHAQKKRGGPIKFKTAMNGVLMEMIKRIADVRENAIVLNGLEDFNNRTVEVVIFPVSDKGRKSDIDKKNMLKFRGAGKSGFADTSKNVDKIIYGE